MAISVGFLTHRPDMMHTRTAKDWYNFMGARAENLGIAAKLYPKHTASYFTEAFGNVMYNDSKKGNKFQPISSMEFNWEIQSNEIRRVFFAESVSDTYADAHGIEIPMVFTEKYYGVNDTFIIDGSKQVCIVLEEPIRKADDRWEYCVRLMDGDLAATLDTDACQAGMTTRWLGE